MKVQTAPKSRPAAVSVSVLLALFLVGIAAFAVRDLAVTQGWSKTGTPWSVQLVDALDGLTPTTGVVVGGIAVALVGLLLILLALKPAPATHLQASTGPSGDADLWVSRAAVAALAQAVADRSPGVISADATNGSGRKITIDVVTSQDTQTVADRVNAAIAVRLQSLTKARIIVRMKEIPR